MKTAKLGFQIHQILLLAKEKLLHFPVKIPFFETNSITTKPDGIYYHEFVYKKYLVFL